MQLNPLITNESLINFLETLRIDEDQKKVLKFHIPGLNEKQRWALLETLIKVYFLDIEEEEVKERLKKYLETKE